MKPRGAFYTVKYLIPLTFFRKTSNFSRFSFCKYLKKVLLQPVLADFYHFSTFRT